MSKTIELIARLRKETLVSLTKAKESLNQNNNDYSKALEFIKKSTESDGLAKVEKLAGRTAECGVIAVYCNSSAGSTIVQVNCETDFVARSTQFREFVEKIASRSLGKHCDAVKEEFEKERVRLVGLLGERIDFVNTLSLTEGSVFGAYVHALQPGWSVGRIGSIVSLSGGDSNLAKQMARHIVGLNPASVAELLSQDFLTGGNVGTLLCERNIAVNKFVRFQIE